MKNTNKNQMNISSVEKKLSHQPRMTNSDLEIGEALLAHISIYKSPVREKELVKFVFNWDYDIQRNIEQAQI